MDPDETTAEAPAKDLPATAQASTSGEPQQAAADPALTEDGALALLNRPDLPSESLEALSKNGGLMKHRKVRVGVARHPNTPRHISLPVLRQLYTFDLMQVALTPITPADVKKAADEVLAGKLGSISSGERLSLAKRGSNRIAGELLVDKEPRIMQAALENGRLTEAVIIKALARYDAPAPFVEAVCHHAKWSLRREVRIALMRNDKTPLARALEFARALPPAMVREILQNSRLPASTKAYIQKELSAR